MIFWESVFGQSKSCAVCSRIIQGKYISAEGKYFHPQHFLCYKCGKQIKSDYQYEDGNFYHHECYADVKNLKCAICKKYLIGMYINVNGKVYHRDCYENNIVPACEFCGKPITGRYIVKDGKKYHDYCYAGDVAEKCSICSKALLQNYLTDFYGNKFHPAHGGEYSECDNCKRLICSSLTGGGVKYEDGRQICNLCFNKSYKGNIDTKNLLKSVLKKLKELGFELKGVDIEVFAVDRNQLKIKAAESYGTSMNGYCRTEIRMFSKNGIAQKKLKHNIYVLNRIPMVNIEATLVHELMHVWLQKNTNGKQMSDLREGSCNYLSYVFLKNENSSKTGDVVLQIENESDKIYGDGFRKVKEKFFNKKLKDFFDYLLSNSNI